MLSATLLKFSLALEQLLLLFHSLFHFLITLQQLLLHILDLLQKFLLLRLFLLLSLLLDLKLSEKLLSFLLSDSRLCLKLGTFLLELLANGFLVLLKSVLHLSHLLFINGDDHIGRSDLAWHTGLALHVELTT